MIMSNLLDVHSFQSRCVVDINLTKSERMLYLGRSGFAGVPRRGGRPGVYYKFIWVGIVGVTLISLGCSALLLFGWKPFH